MKPSISSAWTAERFWKPANSRKPPSPSPPNRIPLMNLSPTREAQRRSPPSADADLLNQARQFRRRNIIKRPLVFLSEPFSKVFRGHEARLAIGKVAPRARPEFHKSCVRQTHNRGAAVHQEFAIHGIAMAGGNAVPKMREAHLIPLPRQRRGHVKRADEIAHRPVIGYYGFRGGRRHASAPIFLASMSHCGRLCVRT